MQNIIFLATTVLKVSREHTDRRMNSDVHPSVCMYTISISRRDLQNLKKEC